jgi:hypothetical protein
MSVFFHAAMVTVLGWGPARRKLLVVTELAQKEKRADRHGCAPSKLISHLNVDKWLGKQTCRRENRDSHKLETALGKEQPRKTTVRIVLLTESDMNCR